MNETSFSANLQAYLQSYDPELKAAESENGDYLFEKLTYINRYRSITHVSAASDHSTANLRIYILDFFPEKQTISGSPICSRIS